MKVENDVFIIEEQMAQTDAETLLLAEAEVEGETLILNCGDANI